ncbi:dihydrolipoyl dehydrogenase [Rhodococcus oxybenzonivorans]|uniref:Dihydrolipoyl dehydrogenase n=1 Tax=Rhodococcus oxybenzonivorans TaxID=1990687 RepID=A0A2S2BZ19_9NOCA|nr:dihydrolipoyl dehydrogenase [Rhodococcus oxybenzonivorans]AWK73885.1 dihydrolipoyl dehydrogenase [Rhodococcus oxybenzonivorans]
MTPRSADVVILGGGSGGYAAAIRSAELGRSVILIEEGDLGGTCLHRGCIPTKALLHAAEVADTAKIATQFGVAATFSGIDVGKVHSYKNSIVTRLHKGLQGLIGSHGITVVDGRGHLVGPNGIEVEGELITGAHIVLATGSIPKGLPGIPLGGRVITSDEALVLPSVPKKAIILGGGVIGVEFASIWSSFGAAVTIVEALPRLVPHEDEAMSTYLERAFRRRKITAKTGTRVTAVVQDGDAVTVTLDSGDVLDADVVLVAVGRVPNTNGMGFEAAGITIEDGFVATDDRLRTAVPSIYAVGDIVRGLQLAHRGFQQGIFVAEDVAGCSPDRIDETGIPRVIYSHPEVASVGVTEAAARGRFGDDIDTVTYDLAGNGKSQILKTTGVVKLVVAPTGAVVGVHMVGDRVGELIGEAQLMYNLEVKASEAAKFVHAHPTQGEALGEALLAVSGKPLHVHA